MTTTISTRSKILSKHGIVTTDNQNWQHPLIDLVYTKTHLINDSNDEFYATLDNFKRRIESKEKSINLSNYILV